MFLFVKNADIYSPEPLGRGCVLAEGGKIIKIFTGDGAAENAEQLVNALKKDFEVRELDASGKKMIPGFIDGHVHIIGGGGEDGFGSLVPELSMTDCIAAGTTTLVGVLGTDCIAKNVDYLVGKAKGLNAQGITAYCLTGSYSFPSQTVTGSVRDDIAFINEVIGVKLAMAENRASNVSNEELARLAAQVRAAALLSGKIGEIHIHTGSSPRGIMQIIDVIRETDIPVKHFHPTHMRIERTGAREFAKIGGMLDFTANPESENDVIKLKNALAEVPLEQITLSSDSNGSFPVWNEKRELIGMGVGSLKNLFNTIRCLYLTGGVAFSDAIKLITENVAKSLNLWPHKGSISEGADADFVLLRNDEIDTVAALGKIAMENGVVTAKNYYSF